MNLHHVTITEFVVGTDDPLRPAVDRFDETISEVGMRRIGQLLGCGVIGHHQGIGEDLALTISPTRFILHRVGDNMV